jgi:hypothetical protein
VAVDGGEAYPKVIRIGFCEFWDVIGDCAAVVLYKVGMAIDEKSVKGWIRQRSAASDRRLGFCAIAWLLR